MKNIIGFLSCFKDREDHGDDKYCLKFNHLKADLDPEFKEILEGLRECGVTEEQKSELEGMLDLRVMFYFPMNLDKNNAGWYSDSGERVVRGYNDYFVDKYPELYQKELESDAAKESIDPDFAARAGLMDLDIYKEKFTEYLVQKYKSEYDLFIYMHK